MRDRTTGVVLPPDADSVATLVAVAH